MRRRSRRCHASGLFPMTPETKLLFNMYSIQTFPCGPFETNAYLISKPESDQVVLIDAPPGGFNIVRSFLKEDLTRIAGILVTHAHFDHVLDLEQFSGKEVPVHAHSQSISGIENPQTLGIIPEPKGGFTGGRVDIFVKNRQMIEIAGINFEPLEVPGHSVDSVAYYVREAAICFVGDLIFHGSVGRTDLTGGDFDTLAESIQKTVYTLPDETVLYPGHGPMTSVGEEKRSNPFVRGLG